MLDRESESGMLRTSLVALLLLTLPSARFTAQQPAPPQAQAQKDQPSPPPQDGATQGAPSQDQAHQPLPPALERINTAADLSTLADPKLLPWHMQLAFDLLEPGGAVREHGTIEVWWASPQRTRIAITSPSYTAVRTVNGSKVFRTRGHAGEPDLDELFLSQAMKPLERIQPDELLTAFSQKTPFGKVNLDCIMPLSKKDSTRHYIGEYTTYCFQPGDAVLRTLIRYRDQFIIRNKTARFQNRELAIDVAVVDGGKLIAKSEITRLTTYTPGEHDFEETPEQVEIPPALHVGSALQNGRLLSKKTPFYPEEARHRNISGVVILHAHIGADGHISSLSMVRSPDKLLTDAAMQAVRQWLYEPYLLNGAPVEVETTITVNFNLG